MKKYAILFLLLSSCVIIENISETEINESFPHNEIQKIAVIMFETPVDEKKGTKTSIAPDAGAILANMTARELAKWGKYVVVNRKALEEELELKNLREEDFLHTGNYSSLGRSLGVDAVVVGKVDEFGFSYKSLSSWLVVSLVTKVSFTAKCIDITTNETIWTVNIKGTSKKDSERVLASELITKAIKTLKAKLN
jgi:hypothetical protein